MGVELAKNELPPPFARAASHLPFEHISWTDFQRLINDLIASEYGVQSYIYGVQGQKQNGADLVARLPSDADHEVYIAAECKHRPGSELRRSDVEGSVQNFLDGKWSSKTRIFVFATSCSAEKTSVAESFLQAERLLAKVGIEFVAWNRDKLHSKLRSCPDIVSERFNLAHCKAFCQVPPSDIHFDFSALSDNINWVSQNERIERQLSHDMFIFNSRSFRAIVNLPRLYKSGHCYISFKDEWSFDLLLSNSEFLASFLNGYRTDPRMGERPFIVGDVQKGESAIVAIGKATLELPYSDVLDLSLFADEASKHYEDRIRDIDNTFALEGFKHSDSHGGYELAAINCHAWACISRFISDHDYSSGVGDLNIFNGRVSSAIRVDTRPDDKRFMPGVHCVLNIRRDNRWSASLDRPNDGLVITWEPSPRNDFDDKFDSLNNWSAGVSFNWLFSELLPAIDKRLEGKDPYSESFDELGIRPIRDRLVNLDDERISIADLQESANQLQAFFSVCHHDLKVVVSKQELEGLYQAVELAISCNKKPDVYYLASKMPFDSEPDKDTILSGLKHHIENLDSETENTYLIDLAFRCLQVTLEDGGPDFHPVERYSIAQRIRPFNEIKQRVERLNRHSLDNQSFS